MYLKTPNGIAPIEVILEVVRADIPALLGLDVLDRERLTPDTAFNRLAKRHKHITTENKAVYIEDWYIPMRRSRSRHSYVPLRVSIDTYFTRSQLHTLHRQFFHPSAEKLYRLLLKSRPEDTTPETKKILEDLTKRCDPCQRMRGGPTRFRVSLGADEVRFNEKILIDIMYIGSTPVLHIVDEGTHFSAATFLEKCSSEDIWKGILKCWATIYTGLPSKIIVDQGSEFGKRGIFASLVANANVELETAGTEAHSSLGIGERYHQPLRNTYRKLIHTYPSADKNLLLAFAVKGMNDTLGPEGLVPSALVFGEFPPAYTKTEVPKARPSLSLRAEIANTARKEMNEHMAKLRVNRALKHKAASSTDSIFTPGDEVLVWREKIVNHRIGEWIGPFIVDSVEVDKKIIFVRDEKKRFSYPIQLFSSEEVLRT